MPCAVVKMAAKPVRAIDGNDSGMSRPDKWSAGFQKRRAAVSQQIQAVRVEIRARDFFAPAGADFISAVRAPTAEAPVHKQVIITIMPVNVRRLDRFVVGQ